MITTVMRRALIILHLLIGIAFPADAEPRHKLAMVAYFQDEAPYLKEWIEFHRLIGFEYFRLYNNRSSDHYLDVLEPYIQKGIVRLIDWNRDNHNHQAHSSSQMAAYDDAVRALRDRAEWVAFLDIDEFLFPVKNVELYTYLKKKCSDYGGVVVNWQCYGTSGVQTIQPHELLIEKLTMKAPRRYWRNAFYKSIVQPQHVSRSRSAHYFRYKNGRFHALPNGRSPGVEKGIVQVKELRINHYWTRDKSFLFGPKLTRYKVWMGAGISAASLEASDRELNAVEDRAIFKYIAPLKERMGLS